MISPASKIGILLANALRTMIATAMDYSLIHVGPLYTKFYKWPTGYTSVASPWSVIMIDTHSLFTKGPCCRTNADEGDENGVSGEYPNLVEDTPSVLQGSICWLRCPQK